MLVLWVVAGTTEFGVSRKFLRHVLTVENSAFLVLEKAQEIVLLCLCAGLQGQEPGSAEEVCQWSKDRFKTTFPILDKVDVSGGRPSHGLVA